MESNASRLAQPNSESKSNRWKERLARVLIGCVAGPWKLADRLSGQRLPAKDHYYIMKMFRMVFKSYDVRITYANPLTPERKLSLKLDLCENSHQWYFRLRGDFDSSEMRLIAEAMTDADSFFDVGANIGIYSVTIAQAFPAKEVNAIEPLPANHARLVENMAINRLSNCVSWQKAVASGGDSKLRFYVNPIHDGGGSLLVPSVFKTGDVELDVERYQREHPEFQPWIEVETMRLEDVISRKSVLKIDVEGSEVDVLRSVGDGLGAGLVDLMVVEVLQDTVDEVIRLVEAQFDCFLMPEHRPITVGTRLPWFVRNILCVRRNSAVYTKLGSMLSQ